MRRESGIGKGVSTSPPFQVVQFSPGCGFTRQQLNSTLQQITCFGIVLLLTPDLGRLHKSGIPFRSWRLAAESGFQITDGRDEISRFTMNLAAEQIAPVKSRSLGNGRCQRDAGLRQMMLAETAHTL